MSMGAYRQQALLVKRGTVVNEVMEFFFPGRLPHCRFSSIESLGFKQPLTPGTLNRDNFLFPHTWIGMDGKMRYSRNISIYDWYIKSISQPSLIVKAPPRRGGRGCTNDWRLSAAMLQWLAASSISQHHKENRNGSDQRRYCLPAN